MYFPIIKFESWKKEVESREEGSQTQTPEGEGGSGKGVCISSLCGSPFTHRTYLLNNRMNRDVLTINPYISYRLYGGLLHTTYLRNASLKAR